MGLFTWLTGEAASAPAARALYGRAVTAARQPVFYTHLGVPDTAEGRFEMIVLHLALALEALKSAPGDASERNAITQRTIETFVTDMDDAMREMGVGDLTVPKKVKRAAAAFYDRAVGYRAGLAAPDEAALTAGLTQTFKDIGCEGVHAASIADYARRLFRASDSRAADALLLPNDVAAIVSAIEAEAA